MAEKDINSVLGSLNGNALFIYGAGCWGNLLYQYCRRKDIPVAGYIVTRPSAQDISNGLPVFSLDQYVRERMRGQIVICMYYPQQVEEELRRRDIPNAYSLQREELIEISRGIFEGFLAREQVDDGQEVIRLRGLAFINPLMVDRVYFWEFFTDFMDIVLPPEFGTLDYINEGPYERGPVTLSEGNVVFDLGAAIGVFSQYAAGKGCRVYAMEPSERNYEYLRRLDSVFPESRIYLSKLGVADYSGRHTFYTGGESLGYDGFRRMPDLTEETEIHVTTIDDFVCSENLERVDFIKANIEGAERLMLDGARDTIRKFHPKLALRTNHYPDDPEVLERKILDIDSRYQVRHQWKNLYAWVPGP